MLKILKDNAKLYFVWLLIVLCTVFGVMNAKSLFLIALIAFLIFAVFSPIIDSCVLLFGLLPFANIFKFEGGGTSFFTVCELLVVLIAIFKQKKIRSNLFIPVTLLFTFYILVVGVDSFNALAIVKSVIAFSLIYLSTQNAKKSDVVNIAYLLAASSIVMMLLSANEIYFVYIEPYLSDLNFVLDEFGHASDLMRVGGFLGDPNYCSILIIMSLALLCVLYYYKEINLEFWAFLGFLIPLGFSTYSKSYFLCIAMLILFLILFILFPKHKGWALISVVTVAVIVSMILNGKIEAINVIFERFEAGDLTTGRADLNDFYLNYLWSNPQVLFFGEGINADRAIGAWNNVHNIYIESLFKLGIVGSLLYLSVLLISTRIKKTNVSKRKFVNFFPMIFLLILYYALAGITMYDFPFYLSIAFLAKDFNFLNEKGLKTSIGDENNGSEKV